jgi:alkylation response protein AidB-like acyl-CoA dehydrogenase
MRFAFDERQLEFRAQLRAFTDKECGAAAVRAAWEVPPTERAWSSRRWAALAEMGVLGLTVPDAYGGLGLGLVDLVLLLEEAGRSGLPEPVLSTVALAAPLLAELARDAGGGEPAEVLRNIAAGEAAVAVAVPGAPAVADAVGADALILFLHSPVSDGPGSGHPVPSGGAGGAPELHLVASTDVALEPRPSVDGLRGLAAARWAPAPGTLIASGQDAEIGLAGVRRRAVMGTGAMLLGVAERLINMAAEYAAQRHQFGKPIGSFQAVKHHLADALVRLEFARPLVYRAAWSLDVGDPDADLHVSMAKAAASDAANLAARTALQVHGAIGYTWEHDLHLWMKRAWALSATWGDAAEHRALVLGELLGRPAPA